MDEASRKAAARLRTLLSELGIEAEIVDHSHMSGQTSEDASKALSEPFERLLKCLLFISKEKGGEQRVVGAIVAGHQRVDVQKLETVSGFRALRLASRKEVLDITEHQAGGVPPVVLHHICPTFIDFEVLNQPYVIGSAGTEFIGLKIKPEEFLKIGVTPSNITEGSPPTNHGQSCS